MPDGGDTEDEDMSNELADDDNITISPQAASAAAAHSSPPGKQQTNQARVVRPIIRSQQRRHVLSTTTPVNASNNQRHPRQQLFGNLGDRKLSKLLGEGSDDDLFKKPASPSTASSSMTVSNVQRRSKENATATAAAAAAAHAAAAASEDDDRESAASAAGTEADCKPPKYFPPETTTYCEEDGRIVKKITCYETWHVISTPKEPNNKTRQQRTCLELPLVKLANVAARIKVPSNKWTSKVTLYKVSPTLMQRQTMTIFTGDLKSYNIPEEERHKYQPSCVLFRRSVLDRNKCRVPFDRAIIFKNKCFYANIEGKHVNLLGAPEVVNSVKDVELLIDIVDSLALSSDLVEMVTSK